MIKKVNYAGHKFNNNQINQAIQILKTGWLCLGKNGELFQRLFANTVGRKYGIFVNSGSSANFLAVNFLKSNYFRNIRNIDRILTPACGFPTTINPIIQNGFKVTFIDVDLETLNINIQYLQRQLQKYKNENLGLMFAHALGNPVDMYRILQLCQKYNVTLIQDCCDALGSTFDGKHVGTFGLLGTYSFYPAHHITTGQGGMIVTDDYQIYKTIRSLRDWGRQCYCSGLDSVNFVNGRCNNRFSNWLPGLPQTITDHKYSYSQMGFNMKPLQIQAVIGLQQLKSLNQFIQIRKYNYEIIKSRLTKYEQYFVFLQKLQVSDPSWFAFPITLKTDKFKRWDIIKFLQNNGIQTRLYFAGNVLYHKMYQQYFKQKDYQIIREQFPNSHLITLNTFFIGVSHVITKQQVNYMCDKFDQFLSCYSKNT